MNLDEKITLDELKSYENLEDDANALVTETLGIIEKRMGINASLRKYTKVTMELAQ